MIVFLIESKAEFIIKVSAINKAEGYGEYKNKCSYWELDENQVINFFKESSDYGDRKFFINNYDNYFCSITGILFAHKKKWDFTINAGGWASWKNKEETRYFGCGVSQDYLDDEGKYQSEIEKTKCMKLLPQF